VVDELTAEFKMYLYGKKCMALSAPMDACQFADNDSKAEDILDWVQPDLFVVCDPNEIGDKNISGELEMNV